MNTEQIKLSRKIVEKGALICSQNTGGRATKNNRASIRLYVSQISNDPTMINKSEQWLIQLFKNRKTHFFLYKKNIERITGVKISQAEWNYVHRLKYSAYLEDELNSAATKGRYFSKKRIESLYVTFRDFHPKNIKEWKEIVKTKHPNIPVEINKLYERKKTAQEEMNGERLSKKAQVYTHKVIQTWCEDFIYIRSFVGFAIQEGMLREVAKRQNKKYVWATNKEDNKGIDARIGKEPVSAKPSNWVHSIQYCQYNSSIDEWRYTKDKDKIEVVLFPKGKNSE